MPPLVSTVIPVYNNEATIGAAVESVLAQDFRDQEIIVVNDGSTDATAQILRDYKDKIRIVEQPNRGVAAARNAGVKAGSGKFLAFLDADDVWLAGRLAKTVAALDANHEAVLAFSDLIAAEPSGEIRTVITGPAPSMDDLLGALPRIQIGTWLMRRSAFERCGGFCEEFRACGGEDLYMLLRARELGEFAYVSAPLLRYHEPAWSASARKYNLARRKLSAILRERYGERSRIMRRELKRMYASSYLQQALQQIDRRELPGAALSLARSMRCDPLFVFQCGGLGRAFSIRNLARLRRLFPGARRDS